MPCQTKIANLHNPLVAVQDVGGLEVPMQDPVLVQICHSAEDLAHDALGLRNSPAQSGQVGGRRSTM